MIRVDRTGVYHPTGLLNRKQEAAIRALVHELTGQWFVNGVVTGPAKYVGTDPANEILWQFTVKATSYGTAWVTVHADVPSLGENNVLRVLTCGDNYWHVEVGKRGKLTAFAYPRSVEQFAGKEWCGIHIDPAQARAANAARLSATAQAAKGGAS